MHDEEIDLRELLFIVLSRKWWILGLTILFAVMSFTYTRVGITPMYKSQTTLMVQGNKGLDTGSLMDSFDLGSINLSQKLVVTYGEIVKSRVVLEQVIDRLKLDLTYQQLLSRIQSSPVGSTEILLIVVQDEDPQQAALIANTIADVFMKEVIRILRVNNVETIDTAIAVSKPINVRLSLNVAIAIVLGVMLGCFIAFAVEYLDNTLKTEQDVSKYLGLHLIGAVPVFDTQEGDRKTA